MKVLMDLVVQARRASAPVQRHDIAARQGVPADYLDQILARLRRTGLVESVRGRSGGYRLTKAPEEISAWDLINSVEDSPLPVICLEDHRDHACAYELACTSKSAWSVIGQAMKSALSDLTLDKLMMHMKTEDEAQHLMCPIGGVRECKPGMGKRGRTLQEAAL